VQADTTPPREAIRSSEASGRARGHVIAIQGRWQIEVGASAQAQLGARNYLGCGQPHALGFPLGLALSPCALSISGIAVWESHRQTSLSL